MAEDRRRERRTRQLLQFLDCETELQQLRLQKEYTEMSAFIQGRGAALPRFWHVGDDGMFPWAHSTPPAASEAETTEETPPPIENRTAANDHQQRQREMQQFLNNMTELRHLRIQRDHAEMSALIQGRGVSTPRLPQVGGDGAFPWARRGATSQEHGASPFGFWDVGGDGMFPWMRRDPFAMPTSFVQGHDFWNIGAPLTESDEETSDDSESSNSNTEMSPADSPNRATKKSSRDSNRNSPTQNLFRDKGKSKLDPELDKLYWPNGDVEYTMPQQCIKSTGKPYIGHAVCWYYTNTRVKNRIYRHAYCLGVDVCPRVGCGFKAVPRQPEKTCAGAPARPSNVRCPVHGKTLVNIPCSGGDPSVFKKDLECYPCAITKTEILGEEGTESTWKITHTGNHNHPRPPRKTHYPHAPPKKKRKQETESEQAKKKPASNDSLIDLSEEANVEGRTAERQSSKE